VSSLARQDRAVPLTRLQRHNLVDESPAKQFLQFQLGSPRIIVLQHETIAVVRDILRLATALLKLRQR
jgi:hypothetical protein